MEKLSSEANVKRSKLIYQAAAHNRLEDVVADNVWMKIGELLWVIPSHGSSRTSWVKYPLSCVEGAAENEWNYFHLIKNVEFSVSVFITTHLHLLIIQELEIAMRS